LCGTLTVNVTCAPPGTADPFPTGTLTAFATAGAAPGLSIATSLPPGGSVDCTFVTTMPSNATAVDLQGISVTQPLTWTWTQA
jgi:hypothetical protein